MEGENAGGTNHAMPLPWWMEALKIRGGFWQSMLHSRLLLLRLCSLDWELRVSAELRLHTIHNIRNKTKTGIKDIHWSKNIQLRADAMTHLKYWFHISSILERTKNSTKTNNTSFKRSDSRLLKIWRFGAWHSYWPATPTLNDKLNFLGEEAVASLWCCHAPVLQECFCTQSGL